jgi:Ca-activated chloride channel family protein
MAQIHRRLGSPVLTGLRLEPSGFEVVSDTLVPGRMPDLFAGAPLCVWGRYHGASEGTLVLQAQDEKGQPWSVRVPTRMSRTPAVTTVWARGHVRELEDRFVIGREDRNRLEKQILETSLRYGVLCRFTAFVAVDKAEVVNESGRVHRVTQAVETPAGWDMPESIKGRRMVAKRAVDRSAKSFPVPRAPATRAESRHADSDTTMQPTTLPAGIPANAAEFQPTMQPPADPQDVLSLYQLLEEDMDEDSEQACACLPAAEWKPSMQAPKSPPPSESTCTGWRADRAVVRPKSARSRFKSGLWSLLITVLILLALAAGIWYLL